MNILAYDWGVLMLPQNINIPAVVFQETECEAERAMKIK